MPVSVELAEAAAQVTLDLAIELNLSVEDAGKKSAELFDEVQNRAPEFTQLIYRQDAPKGVEDVALTLLVMAAQLVVYKRTSIKTSVWDAMTAINDALKHARDAEKKRLALAEARSA